jgi:hypothetical protein
MASIVSVNTYTHSVTFVTDQMLNSLKKIITGIGLDPQKFVSDWSLYERGVKAWLDSKHLKEAVLEITSEGNLVSRCDFTIDYSYSTGDGTMWVDADAIRYSLIKMGVKPNLCTYSLKLRVGPGAPDVVGWADCEFLSTAGFVKQNIGTTIGTNDIGAQSSYWRKI